jgi:EAL domain-containing protein (putative c-di-GMP-specific phosphodiesterase class I)/GGDEF domain-containing protein
MAERNKDLYSLAKVPALEEKISLLLQKLKKEGKLALICIDTQSLLELQDTFDKSMYDTVLYAVQSCFGRLCGSEIRKDDIIASNISNGKKYYIFLSKAREKRPTEVSDLERIAFRIQEFIYNRLFQTFYPFTKRGPQVKVGYGMTYYYPQLHERSILQNVIEEAEEITTYLELKYGLVRKVLLHDIILNQEGAVFYQPLMDLETEKVAGYEAFLRGPEGTLLSNVYNLMNYAREAGFENELEWVSRMQIVAKARGLAKNKMLFLRVGAVASLDSASKAEEFLAGLAKSDIEAERVIFEIDDRSFTSNPELFRKILSHYPDIRFLVEVDETWTDEEIAGLEEKRIGFLKVGLELVRDINSNEANQGIVKSMAIHAHSQKMKLSAVGIHTLAELETLKNLGVDLGQGFFFAKPAREFAELEASSEIMEDRALQKKLLLSIYFKRGREYFQNADYDKAILEFSKVLEIDPFNSESYYYRGFSYCEEGVYTVAMKDLVKLKEIDPEFMNNWLLEGLIAERKGDKERALGCYKEYLERAAQSFDTDVTFAQSRIKSCRGV